MVRIDGRPVRATVVTETEVIREDEGNTSVVLRFRISLNPESFRRTHPDLREVIEGKGRRVTLEFEAAGVRLESELRFDPGFSMDSPQPMVINMETGGRIYWGKLVKTDADTMSTFARLLSGEPGSTFETEESIPPETAEEAPC
jgi:hypothetical protein